MPNFKGQWTKKDARLALKQCKELEADIRALREKAEAVLAEENVLDFPDKQFPENVVHVPSWQD